MGTESPTVCGCGYRFGCGYEGVGVCVCVCECVLVSVSVSRLIVARMLPQLSDPSIKDA